MNILKSLHPIFRTGIKHAAFYGNVRHYHDEHATLISEDVRHSPAA
ncbi:hypothetical protein [Bacillus sp. LBG-1-113]|nr:hypothetical protein [Bacillus sp. LBG-1-113]MCC2930167.1 hypothetical protein [Bacillus sp. LBG-1-113]